VIYTCPACGQPFDAVDLQQPAGVGGGSYCPNCQERIHISFPHSRLVFVVSFLLAAGFLLLFHIRSIFWTPIGAVLLAIPISIYLNVWSTRFKPATFKKWKPRSGTFHEWLYKRNKPPDMFDKEGD
jgi:DNA-directed RNA polymerase subunit RPC12/RpoP